MSLRVRLVVAFFFLSVVPLAAMTFYTYTTNAAAMRDAAGREAKSLAGELTERMKVVTAQLSQHFERLMDIPATPTQTGDATPTTGQTATTAATASAPAAATSVTATTDSTTLLVAQLGELSMLLNNIEVRGFGRRGGRTGGAAGSFGRRGGTPGGPPPPPGEGVPPLPVPPDPSTTPRSPDVAASRGRFPGPPPVAFDGGAFRRGEPGRGPFDDAGRVGGPPPDSPGDPNRIQIDLGPIRRELLQQFFPERERWDQLSGEERELILAKVNERMLGIQQGIQLLQQKASEQAASAQTAASAVAAPKPAKVETPRPPPSSPARMERQTALTGTKMDVRVMQNGEVLGQVNAEINLPNLIATVFTTMRRERGEVPFAVDKTGNVFTPTEADRKTITALNTPITRANNEPGTALLPDWVVVTTPDPSGTGLKFGIARPLGEALDDLRRSSARDAALGLGLIGLALIGIVPLSSRLTRDLSRLSDGVNRIAKGDYQTRVDVSSHDEVGRLAVAFNRMAADVERHQRSAIEQERLHRELELGRQIQHDMLPQQPLTLGRTEIRGVSVAATEVGGDFFNYFQTQAGKIALVVGDVSGKGVGAALLMANIQASLRTRLALGQELTLLAGELDQDIGASTPGSVYATLFVGLLDPHSRALEYVNAGHNPPFVLRGSGGLERMEATGLPIGLLAGGGYKARTLALSAGDMLFFYTDGCVEAENASGEMFGSSRLEQLLTQRSGEDTLVRVEREITAFRSGREPFDDATMMVVNVG